MVLSVVAVVLNPPRVVQERNPACTTTSFSLLFFSHFGGWTTPGVSQGLVTPALPLEPGSLKANALPPCLKIEDVDE